MLDSLTAGVASHSFQRVECGSGSNQFSPLTPAARHCLLKLGAD